MTTSAVWTDSSVRGFGNALLISSPTSRIATTTAELRCSEGSDPAERTCTVPPARRSRSAAAICERPALCTHTKSTSGTVRPGASLTAQRWTRDRAARRSHWRARVRVQRDDRQPREPAPEQLGCHKREDGCRADAGECIRELACDRDCRVGETRRRREEIRTRDICADSEWDDRGPSTAHCSKDHEQQAERCNDLAKPETRRRAQVRRYRHCGEREHEIRKDHPHRCSRDLSDDIRSQFAAAQAREASANDPQYRAPVRP